MSDEPPPGTLQVSDDRTRAYRYPFEKLGMPGLVQMHFIYLRPGSGDVGDLRTIDMRVNVFTDDADDAAVSTSVATVPGPVRARICWLESSFDLESFSPSSDLWAVPVGICVEADNPDGRPELRGMTFFYLLWCSVQFAKEHRDDDDAQGYVVHVNDSYSWPDLHRAIGTNVMDYEASSLRDLILHINSFASWNEPLEWLGEPV